MNTADEWEEFRTFPSLGAAEAISAHLESEGVPTFIESRKAESAVEALFVVFVVSSLAHRARWVTAQLPPSDEELNFLATGKLPKQE